MAFGIDDILLALAMAGIQYATRPKGSQAATTQETTTPPFTPKDPGYSLLSPALLSMMLQNYGRLSGAGYPGGQGIGGDWISSILDTLGQSKESIFGNASSPKQDLTGWSKVSLSDCYKNCQAKGIKYGSPDLESCMKDCMAKGIEVRKAYPGVF